MRKLKCNKNWIPWLRNNEGRKIPSVDGKRWAKWSDRSILLSYDEALFLQQSKPGLEGIGFVIPDGYLVIDLDKCIINNGINDQAQRIIDKYQSYTEKSPSGTGIHIIVKAKVEGGKWTEYIDNQSIEYLTPGNFVTFTGDVVVDNDIVVIEKPVKESLCASREIEKGPIGVGGDIKKPARYGKSALDGECKKVMEAKTGSRTNTLLKASFKIGQLISGGYVNESDAIRDLSIAGTATGLPKPKVQRTVEAGISKGKSDPRNPR
jgi:primase-polymerase (primpol)-like protein